MPCSRLFARPCCLHIRLFELHDSRFSAFCLMIFFFFRHRHWTCQELQRDSLLLVADEYRALRLASRGIVALQRHAGRRHVNRALGQLADAHLRRQRLKVGLQSVRAHVFESKKRRIQERAAAAEGSQKLLRRCFRRWAVVAHNATEASFPKTYNLNCFTSVA